MRRIVSTVSKCLLKCYKIIIGKLALKNRFFILTLRLSGNHISETFKPIQIRIIALKRVLLFKTALHYIIKLFKFIDLRFQNFEFLKQFLMLLYFFLYSFLDTFNSLLLLLYLLS
jgi:hypothetical protein